MSPTPPAGLVRDLQAYDASLRLRWGRHQNVWMLEKKLSVRLEGTHDAPNPLGTSQTQRDLYEGAKDGWVHILSIPPTLLTSAVVLKWLHENDLHVQGSFDAINRRLEAMQEAEERARDRELDLFVEIGSREIHDTAAWLDGRRVSQYNPPVEVGEAHDGFRVLDRRVRA